jgi:hypothetical protein
VKKKRETIILGSRDGISGVKATGKIKSLEMYRFQTVAEVNISLIYFTVTRFISLLALTISTPWQGFIQVFFR